jgi:hypothetical protein
MDYSLARKEIFPFVAIIGSLIIATIFTDAILHLVDLIWIGRWLGIPGTLLILLSFLYSLRKRKKISFGKPKVLLTMHEVMAWIGALMILVHAGIHIYTVLPWLALTAMLVNIVSGMTGKYLLDRSRRFLADKKARYIENGLSEQDADKKMFWDATSYEVMKKWRAIHIPITLAFVVLSLTHILSILMFWQWK